MADDKTKKVQVLPGDLIQVTAPGNQWRGCVALVRQTHRWGVEVDFLAVTEETGRIGVAAQRFKAKEFAVVGAALILPPEIARARADAIETARLVAKEAGK